MKLQSKNKTKFLHVRVSKEEFFNILDIATRNKTTVSKWVRNAVLKWKPAKNDLDL